MFVSSIIVRLYLCEIYKQGVSDAYFCMPAVLRTGSDSRCGGLIGCCRWAAGFFMLRGVVAMSCVGQSSFIYLFKYMYVMYGKRTEKSLFCYVDL